MVPNTPWAENDQKSPGRIGLRPSVYCNCMTVRVFRTHKLPYTCTYLLTVALAAFQNIKYVKVKFALNFIVIYLQDKIYFWFTGIF